METATPSARRAAQSRWTERFGRFGFVAKGALYAIIGVIAIKVAAGQGGNAEDQGAHSPLSQMNRSGWCCSSCLRLA